MGTFAPLKTSISKEGLADHTPNDDVRLDAKTEAILLKWLASRYNRGSFAEEFVDRLRKHIGRHTFATRTAEAGIDLATLAAILGHASIRIAQRYVHPTAEHKKAAILQYGQRMQGEQQSTGRSN